MICQTELGSAGTESRHFCDSCAVFLAMSSDPAPQRENSCRNILYMADEGGCLGSI